MGKVGSVSLQDLETNPFTRTHAADGYAKVNPWGGGPTEFAAPHSLNAWENYNHTADPDSGDDLEVTVGYREVTIDWVKHSLYENGACRQLVYHKTMGSTEDLSTNPFSSPSGTSDVDDVATYTITGLTAGNFYAIGLKAEFDDTNGNVELPADDNACNVKTGQTPLNGGGEGLSTGVAVYASEPSPVTATQTSTTDCFFGVDNVTIRVTIGMKGPSLGHLQYQKNGGSWTDLVTSLSAGTTTYDHVVLGDDSTYKYRCHYHDISPDSWATMTGTVTASCANF
jgi:hypothetical protein